MSAPAFWRPVALAWMAFSTVATAHSAHGAQAATAAAQAPSDVSASGYNQPPAPLLDVLRAPAPPIPSVSPSRQTMLLVSWMEYPSIARVATPFLKLAGTRVETRNHSKHDTPGGYGIAACARSFELVQLPGGARTPVDLPAGSCPGAPHWSSDGRHFAFANVQRESVELWLGDGHTGALRRAPGVWLNQALNGELQWMPDQKTLLVKTVPTGQGPAPAEPLVPPGPSIQQTGSGSGQSSTYETRDTLRNPHDEELFDYYARSQLALVDVASLTVAPVGQPALYNELKPAPDGRHLLVTRLHKPYSYVTTYERFPHAIEVWRLASRDQAALTQPSITLLADIPLADRVPIAGVRNGPRGHAWRPAEAATLVWAEALDGGDWKNQVAQRDKVLLQKAPFSAQPVEIARTQQRFVGLAWGERTDTALLEEYDENRHWRKSFLVNVDNPKQPPRLLWDFSSDEKYGNPGRPVYRQHADGEWVMRQEGDAIYLQGIGASPDGDRPFLDKLDLNTLQSRRLFRSDSRAYERFIAFTGIDDSRFLTWHQSVLDAPNAWLRTRGPAVVAAAGEAAFSSERVAVTHLPDPTPTVRGIQKRLVKYKRADGLDLSFTLYTPPGYQPGTRVPTILYAYPLDFADASKAAQVTGSQATFTRLRQYQLLLMAGYAIIDRASFPIVGDPKRAYDTYLEQLVADAQAAVNEAVRLGVTDPERVGVTGHSHGALMTVNLIAHSQLFRAGVATSGSYNKTLTPFGFQSERRSVWEAPEVYTKASPFFYADKIKTPLLIVHGADDANPGTTPLQASKLFEAVRGNGGTARLVMLPFEPHWYTALESNEQLVYEMVNWFDRYVKYAPPRAALPVAVGQ
jgi:dipeptidyl aminopeptidase/acylaminoacyl peptidase